jgi:hypothetical protein
MKLDWGCVILEMVVAVVVIRVKEDLENKEMALHSTCDQTDRMMEMEVEMAIAVEVDSAIELVKEVVAVAIELMKEAESVIEVSKKVEYQMQVQSIEFSHYPVH